MSDQTAESEGLERPEGIGQKAASPPGVWQRHASPLSLLVFGAVVAVALSGLLGREADWRASASGVELLIHGPAIIRNGEFMEMRFELTTDDPIDELVIGVDVALWEDLTVNTMIPSAAEEESRDGEFLFTFSRIDAGTAFFWKVDLQVNPDIFSGNYGVVTVYDGEAPLVSTDLSITVLP